MYGDVSLILFPVYRTHDKRGLLCAASALRGPAFYSQFVSSVWTRAYIWDPRFQTACMQAGVYSGLTGGVAYRGVPQSRVGYARFGLPAGAKPIWRLGAGAVRHDDKIWRLGTGKASASRIIQFRSVTSQP